MNLRGIPSISFSIIIRCNMRVCFNFPIVTTACFLLLWTNFVFAQNVTFGMIDDSFQVDVDGKVGDIAEESGDQLKFMDLLRIRNNELRSYIRGEIQFKYSRNISVSAVSFEEEKAYLDTHFVAGWVAADNLFYFNNEQIREQLRLFEALAAIPLGWGVLTRDNKVIPYGFYWKDSEKKPPKDHVKAPRTLSAFLCVKSKSQLSLLQLDEVKEYDFIGSARQHGCDRFVQIGPRIVEKKAIEIEGQENLSRRGIFSTSLFSTSQMPVNVILKWKSSNINYVTLLYVRDKVSLWEVQALILDSNAFRSAIAHSVRANEDIEVAWAVQTGGAEIAGLYTNVSPWKDKLSGGSNAGQSMFSSMLMVRPKNSTQ